MPGGGCPAQHIVLNQPAVVWQILNFVVIHVEPSCFDSPHFFFLRTTHTTDLPLLHRTTFFYSQKQRPRGKICFLAHIFTLFFAHPRFHLFVLAINHRSCFEMDPNFFLFPPIFASGMWHRYAAGVLLAAMPMCSTPASFYGII